MAAPAGGRLLIVYNEIVNDPTTQGYAGKTSAQRAAMMNTPLSSGTTTFNINVQTLAQVLIRQRKWEAIKSAHDVPAAPGHADAFALYELVQLGQLADNLASGAIATAIGNLVALNILNAADAAAIFAACTQNTFRSRAQVLGVDPVTQGDIDASGAP